MAKVRLTLALTKEQIKRSIPVEISPDFSLRLDIDNPMSAMTSSRCKKLSGLMPNKPKRDNSLRAL
eukprot:CCRYP_019798-RA/>CCRYP_019798-RA protein AED:0.06 eAED:0.06 QI:978/1/1/1/0/0/2/551/65